MRRITIALLLAILIFISGCVAISACSPENPAKSKQTEAESILKCMNECHKFGLGWKAQVIGQSLDKTTVYCTCYTCFV